MRASPAAESNGVGSEEDGVGDGDLGGVVSGAG